MLPPFLIRFLFFSLIQSHYHHLYQPSTPLFFHFFIYFSLLLHQSTSLSTQLSHPFFFYFTPPTKQHLSHYSTYLSTQLSSLSITLFFSHHQQNKISPINNFHFYSTLPPPLHFTPPTKHHLSHLSTFSFQFNFCFSPLFIHNTNNKTTSLPLIKFLFYSTLPLPSFHTTKKPPPLPLIHFFPFNFLPPPPLSILPTHLLFYSFNSHLILHFLIFFLSSPLFNHTTNISIIHPILYFSTFYLFLLFSFTIPLLLPLNCLPPPSFFISHYQQNNTSPTTLLIFPLNSPPSPPPPLFISHHHQNNISLINNFHLYSLLPPPSFHFTPPTKQHLSHLPTFFFSIQLTTPPTKQHLAY